MKVLIVDDEDDIRRIARLSLTRVGGMDVVEAGSGPDGLRKAEEEKPDAILLDVMLPGMDGLAILAALKANPATASTPVIFLTAKALSSEVEKLKGLGAAGILTKPFDPMTLPHEITSLLSKPGGGAR